MRPEWQFVVCRGCAGGDVVAEAAAASGARVARAECLSVCAAPVTLALQGPGRATYVFSGVTAEDRADLAALATAYDAAEWGWITDARPLGRLRLRLVTRVPALDIA